MRELEHGGKGTLYKATKPVLADLRPELSSLILCLRPSTQLCCKLKKKKKGFVSQEWMTNDDDFLLCFKLEASNTLKKAFLPRLSPCSL